MVNLFTKSYPQPCATSGYLNIILAKENISNEPAPLPPKASTSTLPKPTKTLDQKTLDQLSHFLDQ